MTDTHEISTELVKYIEQTLFSNDYVCNFFEDVLIDNIRCSITLKYFLINGTVRLILHNKNIEKKLFEQIDDDDDEYLYNLLSEPDFITLCVHIPIIEKCRFTLINLNEYIKNIKFCKYSGKFIHIKNIHYCKIRNEVPIFFKNNLNIKFNPVDSNNNCSVCYEQTITISSCNHPICIPCAMLLKQDLDDDILCPICRQLLYFL